MSLSRRPKLGQHFLQDPRYRRRIVDALPLCADDVIVEIGPGRGALTRLLADRARKVIAIELDCALAGALHEEFRAPSRVEIICADILHLDLAPLCAREGIAQTVVFGNLPYYITSPILHHLWAQRDLISAMGLLMQREVAERLTAAPGTRDYGYLTVAAQTCSTPRIAFEVPPGAFSPPPKVQSALVTIEMRPPDESALQLNIPLFLDFVRACFAQKRKKLINNLAGLFPRDQVLQSLAGIGKPPHMRAEQLSVKELSDLFLHLTRAAGWLSRSK